MQRLLKLLWTIGFGWLALSGTVALAQESIPLAKGQLLYLPVYSHIWYGNFEKDGNPRLMNMSVLVSVRNTDPNRPIRIVSAKYYDTDGKHLADYVTSPKAIPPLGASEFLIERRESMGGSGANFLIRWQADTSVNLPVVEAIHAEIQGTRAVSFVTTARPIRSAE